MIKTIIVDDELPAINILKYHLEKIENIKVIDWYNNPTEAVDAILTKCPDVLFLDIEMPEINGLEFADIVSEKNTDIRIVFVTSYDQYALEAFRVNAIDYLLKPITKQAVDECVNKLVSRSLLCINDDHKPNIQFIQIFGGFKVNVGTELIKWPTKKAEEMFAYFVLHPNEPINGILLGETLWQNSELNKIKANVHTTIYRLRKVIKEYGLFVEIISEKGGNGDYICKFNDITCDFWDYIKIMNKVNHVDEVYIEPIEKMMSLYKGKLCDNKDFIWCQSISEYHQRSFIELLIKFISYYIDQGEYEYVEEGIKCYKELDDFNEEIHHLELLMYFMKKEKANLYRCHEVFKNKFEKEIGMPVSKELQENYQKLINEI